jgi:hypothetical protein
VLDYDSEGKYRFGVVDCRLAIIDLKSKKRIFYKHLVSWTISDLWLNNINNSCMDWNL